MNQFDVFRQKNSIYRFFRRRFIDSVFQAHYLKYSKDISGKTVLEVGCGSGIGTETLLKYFSPKRLIATDLDSTLLELAKRFVKNKSSFFERVDATHMRYKDGQFDAIFELGMLHHMPNWEECVTELNRVLKPGGKIFLLDISIDSFNTDSPWAIFSRRFSSHPYELMYTRNELLSFLKKLGLKVLSQATYGNPQRSFVLVICKGR